MTDDDGAGAPHAEEGNVKPLEGSNACGVGRQGCAVWSSALKRGHKGRENRKDVWNWNAAFSGVAASSSRQRKLKSRGVLSQAGQRVEHRCVLSVLFSHSLSNRV